MARQEHGTTQEFARTLLPEGSEVGALQETGSSPDFLEGRQIGRGLSVLGILTTAFALSGEIQPSEAPVRASQDPTTPAASTESPKTGLALDADCSGEGVNIKERVEAKMRLSDDKKYVLYDITIKPITTESPDCKDNGTTDFRLTGEAKGLGMETPYTNPLTGEKEPAKGYRAMTNDVVIQDVTNDETRRVRGKRGTKKFLKKSYNVDSKGRFIGKRGAPIRPTRMTGTARYHTQDGNYEAKRDGYPRGGVATLRVSFPKSGRGRGY